MKVTLNRQSGFTLIEVIIASAIFATVAVVGTAVLAGTYKAQAQINTTRSRQEAVRTTLEIVGREVRFSKAIAIDSTSNILTVTESDNSKKIFYIDATNPNQKNLLMQKVKEDGSNDGQPAVINSDLVSVDQFNLSGLSTQFNANNQPTGATAYAYIDILVKPANGDDQPFESSLIVSPRGYYDKTN